MPAHFQGDQRQRQDKPDPEATAHVGKLRIGLVLQADRLGLQRHAANRAIAGANLAHLGMHRAGIDGTRRQIFNRRWRGLKKLFRLGDEALPTTAGTEEIISPRVMVAVRRFLRVHGHAAHRVDGAGFCRSAAATRFVIVRGMGVMVRAMVSHGFFPLRYILPLLYIPHGGILQV